MKMMTLDNGIDEGLVNSLAKKYSALDYSANLMTLLNNICPHTNFEKFSKYDLHKICNDIFFENYKGEEILKFKLFERLKNKEDFIGAFEVPIKNSRVDFITVNGRTTSYEIKSELDNLSKLSKQTDDYMMAFEYNYVLLDEKHMKKAKDILPESFGIWSYRNGRYFTSKRSTLNKNINPEVQLSLLTKKELFYGFAQNNGDVQNILNSLSSKSINKNFKKILRNRYRSRWEFLLKNQMQILPIDLQFFFNTNIKPADIYYH